MHAQVHQLDLIKNTFLIGHLRHNVFTKLRVTYIDAVGANSRGKLTTVFLYILSKITGNINTNIDITIK